VFSSIFEGNSKSIESYSIGNPIAARDDSVEGICRLSFIAFGGPQAKAGLSPGWAS
jgi:hypothetical protein